MTIGVTAEVEYVEKRGMWRVTVYHNGVWVEECWFFSQMTAEYFAQRRRLGG